MTPNETRVFALVSAAAAARAPCPTNNELAAALDLASTSSIQNALNGLEHAGRIIIQRFSSSRIVVITGTGDATAATVRDQPLHLRTGRLRNDPVAGPPPHAMAATVTPCAGCGTRSDHGCACPPRPFAGLTIIPRSLLAGLPA
jgi:hypothetical protein